MEKPKREAMKVFLAVRWMMRLDLATSCILCVDVLVVCTPTLYLSVVFRVVSQQPAQPGLNSSLSTSNVQTKQSTARNSEWYQTSAH